MSHFRVSAVLALSVALLCACGGETPAPVELVPANLSHFDANVVELVERQMVQVRSRPEDPAAYAELAYIYEANEIWPAARNAYAEAVRLQPQSQGWRYHLAVATLQAGDQPGARLMFQELAAEYPDLAALQQRLGEALTHAGDLEGAAAAYGRVIELMPGAVEGYHGLGEVRLLQRDYPTARQALERAVALDPRYRAARYALGLAYRGLGLPDEAQREMKLGLDARTRYLPGPLAPQIQRYAVNLPALRNRAASALLGGRPDLSAELLEQVLEQRPGNPTDLNNLAIAYMRLGRLDAAEGALAEARERAPEKFTTWLNLASLATRRGDHAAAAQYATEAVRLAPTMAQPRVVLAMAEAEMGRMEEAAAALGEAVRLDPRDPQTHGMLAEVALELGRPDVAEEQFKAVLALLPDSLTGVINLGRLYARQGRLDEAGAMLDRARELAPGHARVAALEQEIRNHEPGEQP